MKKIIALALNFIFIFGATACAESFNPMPDTHGFYPRTAVVINIDEDNDIVTCRDFAGIEWRFDFVNDWQENDIVSLMMYDNGTPNTIYDDQIRLAYYGGLIEK